MKKFSILLIASLSFLFVACTQGQSQAFQTDYKVGTGGVEANFLPSSPPSTVFSGENFQVSIELKNRGGYNIDPDQGIVSVITDPNTRVTNPTTTWLTFPSEGQPFEGRSFTNPEGGTEIKTYQLNALPLPQQSDQQDSIIQAKICYPYKTELSADVCVDTDIENKLKNKPCKITNPSLSGQGAPVAITALETNLIPSAGKLKPRFTITVANKGSGQVVQSDVVQNLCQGGTGQSFKPIIHVESVILGDRELNCNPIDINLVANDKTTCTYDQGISLTLPPFTTPLIVKLNYGYFQALTKTVTVKR